MPDPALIFEELTDGGPGTHVLIVGIGAYSHLLDGTEPKAEVAETLGQVPVAANSARAVAEWFLNSFENAEKPLASIGLVLSEPDAAHFDDPRTGPRGPLPCGTVGGLEAAVGHWSKRAEGDERNLAVFYICGHGLSYGADILVLLRDFGSSPQFAFRGSVNLNMFMTGMRWRLPKQQLFLVDCCRVTTDLEHRAIEQITLGSPLIDPPRNPVPDREAMQSCHVAVGANKMAYGEADGLTMFTEALLQALNGGGGQSNLGYHVGTAGLHTALGAYLARLAREEDVEQVPELLRNKPFTIHRPRDIKIPLHVTCNPSSVFKRARIEAHQGGNTVDFYDAAQHGERDKWSTLQPMGTYVVKAMFRENDHWVSSSVEVVLSPPEFPCHFELERRKQ